MRRNLSQWIVCVFVASFQFSQFRDVFSEVVLFSLTMFLFQAFDGCYFLESFPVLLSVSLLALFCGDSHLRLS